jgi:hypothetical protein
MTNHNAANERMKRQYFAVQKGQHVGGTGLRFRVD